ncbi:Fur family transcriptional regulator [Parapedomonas caeni]|jgi:Fur family zinc uptake transcriptional regulator
MTHACDHSHPELGAPDFLAAAEQALVGRGEQWTPLRQAVFEALLAAGGPASAYDIAERVSAGQGRRIAANTVYRILDLFVGANLAKRVESRNAFLVCAHPDHAHDCIFLVCESCGATTHIDDDGVAAQIRALARAQGFEPRQPVIEVKGRCAACVAG